MPGFYLGDKFDFTSLDSSLPSAWEAQEDQLDRFPYISYCPCSSAENMYICTCIKSLLSGAPTEQPEATVVK